MWDRRAQAVEVDGDTIIVVLDQGYGDTKTFSLRLMGTWAPDRKDKGWAETTKFVQDWLLAHNQPPVKWPWVVVTTRIKSDEHEVKTLGRYVGTLVCAATSEDLGTAVNAFVEAYGYPKGTGSKGTLAP